MIDGMTPLAVEVSSDKSIDTSTLSLLTRPCTHLTISTTTTCIITIPH